MHRRHAGLVRREAHLGYRVHIIESHGHIDIPVGAYFLHPVDHTIRGVIRICALFVVLADEPVALVIDLVLKEFHVKKKSVAVRIVGDLLSLLTVQQLQRTRKGSAAAAVPGHAGHFKHGSVRQRCGVLRHGFRPDASLFADDGIGLIKRYFLIESDDILFRGFAGISFLRLFFAPF